MGVNVSEGKIEASGKIRGRSAQGSIDDEGVIELGVDFKVGGLGVTTDYGGAIVVTIAGQSITWGREGGLIEYNFAGFQVTVEARDCIVTETKKIAGIVVAEHTYPDPGCELPEPPEPPEPPKPPPGPNGIDPNTITDTGDGYILVGESYYSIFYNYPDPWFLEEDKKGTEIYEGIAKVECTNIPEIVTPPGYYSWGIPVFLAIETNATNKKWVNGGFTYSSSGYTSISESRRNTYYEQIDGTTFQYTEFAAGTVTSQYRTGPYPPATGGIVNGLVAYGSMRAIARWVIQINNFWSSRTSSGLRKKIINKVIPVGQQKPPRPFLPTGNKPPMNKDCCEEILDKLEGIEEVLAVAKLLKDKFPVSNTFMAPGVNPDSKTEAKNYYEIAQCLFRMMAHGMIFEPEAVIKDSDAAKAGDQPLKVRYLNATGWAKAVSEMLFEVRDDGNVATNMDLRNGFTVTQLMVADVVEKVDTILDCIGVPTKHKIEVVTTAFNCLVQVGKGFGADNQKQLDLNEDTATEALLPEFLKTRENKLKTVEIHPRSQSLLEILRDIQKSLPGEG